MVPESAITAIVLSAVHASIAVAVIGQISSLVMTNNMKENLTSCTGLMDGATMDNSKFEYAQGKADGHWYYAPKAPYMELASMPLDKWTGPFMTKACAIQHSKDGTFRVID